MMEKHFGRAVRKIIQVGECSGITIPKEYLDANDLKRGDRVELVYSETLLLRPVRAGEVARELAEASA